MRIDVHNHAVPDQTLSLIAQDTAYGRLEGRRWRGQAHVSFEIDERFFDVGAKLAELGANDIAGAVISLAPPLFSYHVAPAAGEAIARATNEGL
jgi:hypothetical protein